MKKSICFILLGGLFVAGAAYAFGYIAATATQPAVANGHHPALAWMQTEFQLTSEQFARLREVHEAYQPKCLEMCRVIDAKHTEIQTLLAETNVVTPQIRQKLAEAAQIRAECQAAMLEHFYEVAQTMAPRHGKRYLAWVQKQTLKPWQMMSEHSPKTLANRQTQ